MEMDPNQMKEQFSAAYVKAVVSVAGFTMSQPSVDHDSVDWTIARRGGGGIIRSPKLDLQLKCTNHSALYSKTIPFQLKKKNFDDLKGEDFQAPRILVVVIVPKSIENWLKQDETALCMNHCGYWLSLRSFQSNANEDNTTVHLPRSNQFTVKALTAMMDRIGDNRFP